MTLALQTAIKRATLYFGFLYAKNPIRIKQVGIARANNTCMPRNTLVSKAHGLLNTFYRNEHLP